MKHCLFVLFTFGLMPLLGESQTLTSRVVDSATQKPIPYATVLLKNRGVITNDEGRFTLTLDATITPTDTLAISCIGYESLRKPLEEFTEPIIILRPKAIELSEVIVSNKNYTAREIVEAAADSLEENYHMGLTRKRLFLRETFQGNINKSDYTLRKSSIPELKEAFFDKLIQNLPKNNTYYNETLADLYGAGDEDEQKLEIIRASELYDKNQQLDLQILEKKFNAIIQERVKTDSYFKIKSGLFGTKVDVDELFETEVDSSDVEALNAHLEKMKENEQDRRNAFANFKRGTLGGLVENLPIYKGSDYNVLHRPGRYELVLENFTYLGETPVYVISFTPKRWEDFKGRLFVNANDFALIRMDFENTEPLRNFNLLGVSFSDYLAKGTLLFGKGEDGKYDLRYYSILKGNRVGFDRPVKIIEKNKNVRGRRKQNELSLKIDAAFSGQNRYELVVFDMDPISEDQYESIQENPSVLPTYMPEYDPEFWEGYNIMEPNRAIREFTSKATLQP